MASEEHVRSSSLIAAISPLTPGATYPKWTRYGFWSEDGSEVTVGHAVFNDHAELLRKTSTRLMAF